jgi:hypothetical protein
MRFRVVITETNIDEGSHPQVDRFVLDAATETDAAAKARERFTAQTGREPAPRATVTVDLLN